MDPSRPLAKAAMDLDWTTVVSLFPEANRDGYDASRIWVLASIIILGEVSGLSESEVLSRWPENPYWQAFSGFAQFQWKVPVSHADCLTFRRYVDAPRAARLSTIAQSILQSKPVETSSLQSPSLPQIPTVDDALALRQVHFLQPQTQQPYRPPAKSGIQSGIKEAYARSAASTSPSAAVAQSPESPEAIIPAETPQPAADGSPQKPAEPVQGQDVPVAAEVPEKPLVPQFAQTYTMLVKKAAPVGVRLQPQAMEGLAAPETPTSGADAAAPATPPVQSPLIYTMPVFTPAPPAPAPKRNFFGAPPIAAAAPVRQSTAPGTPQFDTDAPFMRRAQAEEPVTMEVVATGEAPLRYQWETFDAVKGTATPIEGCNEPTLTVALEASDSMLAFQCRVSNGPCPQGVVSRTFFIKKAQKSNVLGEPEGQPPVAASPFGLQERR